MLISSNYKGVILLFLLGIWDEVFINLSCDSPKNILGFKLCFNSSRVIVSKVSSLLGLGCNSSSELH